MRRACQNTMHPANKYMLKVINRNTRKGCDLNAMYLN